MFRQYEDPIALEKQLKEAKEEYESRKLETESFEELIDLELEMQELEERVNFAWQDDEYDSEYAGEEFEY